MAEGEHDNLPDAWKKALDPYSNLQQTQGTDGATTPAQTPAPASTPATTTNAPPASTPPPETMWDPLGLGWQVRPSVVPYANALVGGGYRTIADVIRNTGGRSLPPAPANVQTDVTAHPYVAGAGSVATGGAATALPLSMLPEIGTGYIGAGITGAVGGAIQNLLAGNSNEPWYDRLGWGGAVGGPLGILGNRIGSFFGAGRSIPSEVADAAQKAKGYGVTDIMPENLPSRGDIKAAGATPTYAQAGQIDNATSKILGQDVPNWNTTNFNQVQNNIGGAITKAANSGGINVNAPLTAGGPIFSDVLDNIRTAASANPEVAAQINPLISRIQARIGPSGVISGKDFDNLVGNGSVLHDLVGSDSPYIKEAAQTLDNLMDAGFKASSPAGAYDNWVDARTKYRLLMGVKNAILPNGHINPTTLFSNVQSRFTDLKGVPVSADPNVGKMGDFANSIKTLFGGSAAPPVQSSAPGFGQTVKELGVGSLPAIASTVASGNLASPENFMTPQALAGWGLAGADLLGGWAGRAYQGTRGFANDLISARGGPIPNPLVSPIVTSAGVQAFPNRQIQP